MKVIIEQMSPIGSTVKVIPCCEKMRVALDFCFIDDEWNEKEGGFKLWRNEDMAEQYEWKPKPPLDAPSELSINFCPFCGKKIQWERSMAS